MKHLLCFIIPLLVIFSCDTHNKASNEIQQEAPKDSTGKDSINSSVGLQLLEALEKTIRITQTIADSLKSANTPEKILTLVTCDDTKAAFQDSTKKKSRYTVKVNVTFTNQDDSLTLKPHLKSFSITVNQLQVAMPKNLLENFDNIIPCNFEVFESKNKKNLLIYPKGFFNEESEKIILNLTKGKITRVNNTFILD